MIGCYTGLRYSDLSRLDKDNFIGDVLRMRTRKTGWFVEIPLHPIVKRILEGYNYSLPRQTSPQNFNARIKNICKRAEINVPVVVEYTKGFKVHRRKFLKYELISSHTARRSLATNMYLAGVSTFRIMLITGHRTESSFFRYIRISRSQNAKELSMHAFFKMESINLQKNTMIREAIKQALKEKNISQRKCALANNINYSNFSSFLRGGRSLPLTLIEKVLTYLSLEIRKTQ